jgi:hypothetical protein
LEIKSEQRWMLRVPKLVIRFIKEWVSIRLRAVIRHEWFQKSAEQWQRPSKGQNIGREAQGWAAGDCRVQSQTTPNLVLVLES